jgi:geranylgeranyl diphosphate synthase type II
MALYDVHRGGNVWPMIDKHCARGHDTAMTAGPRIEAALTRALDRLEGDATPPGLRAAIRDAVLPGGGRLRPTLCLAVTDACGGEISPLAAADVAAAIELLHSASLVHDDLPCFDDAEIRRGRASVQAAHGEELAILAGDGLIVLAFETIAGSPVEPSMLPRLIRVVGSAVGAAGGLVAGQAWESEGEVSLRAYHRAKTGALFQAAASAGAILGGQQAEPWAQFGARLGEAYQVADDLRDTSGDPSVIGKPVGQDAARDRPSAALALGVGGALQRLEQLVAVAMGEIPTCTEPAAIATWLDGFGNRLFDPQPEPVEAVTTRRTGNFAAIRPS